MTDFIFLGYKITEEGMETHSSVLDWRLPKVSGAWWVTVHGVSMTPWEIQSSKRCLSGGKRERNSVQIMVSLQPL